MLVRSCPGFVKTRFPYWILTPDLVQRKLLKFFKLLDIINSNFRLEQRQEHAS